MPAVCYLAPCTVPAHSCCLVRVTWQCVLYLCTHAIGCGLPGSVYLPVHSCCRVRVTWWCVPYLRTHAAGPCRSSPSRRRSRTGPCACRTCSWPSGRSSPGPPRTVTSSATGRPGCSCPSGDLGRGNAEGSQGGSAGTPLLVKSRAYPSKGWQGSRRLGITISLRDRRPAIMQHNHL